MGKPDGSHVPSSLTEYIGQLKPTQGSETSQYLKERKSNETPRVAASEMGLAQTFELAQRGCRAGIRDSRVGRGRALERAATASDSLVPEPQSDIAGT